MRSWLIGIVVFVAAAAVLVLEIVAGRILAPYVGVSLQTFTGIIGT
ncbi:MAG: fused MFS/spermidine synthase, partial [Actinomycetia bacterium]|nr:fused MFS/spermidine synthase [Actinomycetes bacterium]